MHTFLLCFVSKTTNYKLQMKIRRMICLFQCFMVGLVKLPVCLVRCGNNVGPRSEQCCSLSISAEDAALKSENRKKSTKKEFEINFDDDIDFDVYFGKAKVCAGFITICTLLNYSLHSPFPCRYDFKEVIMNS